MNSGTPDGATQVDGRLGYLLVRSAMRVRQRYLSQLSTLGLLPNQHVILATLHELGPCHQKELATRIGLDTGDLVTYLDGLHTAGAIERTRDPKDRRRQIVSLTPEGRTTLETADRALDILEGVTFGCFSATERALLGEHLARLYRSLST
ncbi:MarR family winged helix-turn-helix transcriptional regulator [Nocardia terpenica]|uniref:MarR family transcriptional regulator n=1 Tax=Nocardia terpenica TaxID=455432 RepID=A0A164LFN7_9NOCA|nr:MarR family transcriptional regulator [Nocardia terpenica]KZM72360.1 hypothetical protein AWN90_36155 [Nocardia terpenica]MBF6065406.1 MarR family transcriptional regulator [Nocardia terpenica]MBF6109088.1 MarR family transcriptional regulator [Nocardia terpenica]MBF6114710.1 MarR family transcriptional regulator [Nocardia terpenica]MBF6123395.1 MarR family transcriptional regulator [Nocardia terpenica]